MFGRKPYKQGDNTLKNVVNYLKSPQFAQMSGQMADGRSFGGAYADSQLFARQNEEQEHQRQLQEHMMGLKMEDRGLNNEYKRAQIKRMNAPGPSPTTWQPYKDQQGNTIGQINTLGKVELFPKNAEKKQGPLKAADGFYYNNDGTRTFPDVKAAEKPVQAPKIITKNLPEGVTQDYEVTPTGLTPFGAPKENNAYEKEKRASMGVIRKTEDSLNRYREALKEHGTEILPGKNKLSLEAAYYDLLLEMKELYKLGVLSGPDMDIMEAVLKDPTSISGNFYWGDSILKQLDSVVVPKIQAAREQHEQTYNQKIPGSTINSDTQSLKEKYGLR